MMIECTVCQDSGKLAGGPCPRCAAPARAVFSQNDEETVIGNYFAGRDPGKLLDIGAFDGRTFSNTLRLIEQGWSAVCVEPSPPCCAALLREHRDNPRVTIVNAAIVAREDGDGMIEFHDSLGDAVSSSNISHVARWGSVATFRAMWVKSISVWNLLNRFGHDFSFLNLDVEGHSAELLTVFQFESMDSLKLICVEHDSKQGMIVNRVSPYGFKVISENAENLILAR